MGLLFSNKKIRRAGLGATARHGTAGTATLGAASVRAARARSVLAGSRQSGAAGRRGGTPRRVRAAGSPGSGRRTPHAARRTPVKRPSQAHKRAARRSTRRSRERRDGRASRCRWPQDANARTADDRSRGGGKQASIQAGQEGVQKGKQGSRGRTHRRRARRRERPGRPGGKELADAMACTTHEAPSGGGRHSRRGA